MSIKPSTVEVFQSAVVNVPVDLRQVSFINFSSEKKRKTEQVEFYGTIIPFKSSPIFLFFGS